MEKKVSQIEESKHFSGDRTVVTFDEKKRWIELWPEVRKQVVSNQEAYQALSGLGLRYRDPRTIKVNLEPLLPLINEGPIAAVIDFVNYCECRMSVKEFMRLIREKFPVEELGPKFANLAEVLIKEVPPPAQVLQALGCILSGGFPFDTTNVRK